MAREPGVTALTAERWLLRRGQVITQGHSADVWGLAIDPCSPSYVTAGDDRTVRSWCIKRNTMLCKAALPAACKTVAVSPDGRVVAVGLESGALFILELDGLTIVHEERSGFC